MEKPHRFRFTTRARTRKKLNKFRSKEFRRENFRVPTNLRSRSDGEGLKASGTRSRYGDRLKNLPRKFLNPERQRAEHPHGCSALFSLSLTEVCNLPAA